ncbi:MAG: hypothetical protein JRJ87_06655 [Deltaproteobacteria bacterium]|nr:hypothetical protein [Deltaproteobacteria bacterium]
MPAVSIRKTLPTALICILVVSSAGCVHSPQILNLEPELVEQILLSEPKTPVQYLSRGWARLVHQNNLGGALTDFQSSADNLPVDSAELKMLAHLGIGLISLLKTDFPSELEAMLAAMEAYPQAPECQLAATLLEEVAKQVPNGHRQISSRVKKLVEPASRTGLECKRVLRRILKAGFLRQGNLEQVKAIEIEMGVVQQWLIGYPFGRHPLVDFKKSFPPEISSLENDAEHPPIFRRSQEGRLNLESIGRGGILYAETFFEVSCPKACRVNLALRVEGPGSWVVFIDNSALDTHAAHLGKLPRVVHLPFVTGRGWHRILLKIPMRTNQLSLAVELTGADGSQAAVNWWTGDKPVPDYPSDQPIEGMPFRAAKDVLVDRFNQNQQDPISGLLAGMLIWEDGNQGRAREIFNQARQRAAKFCLSDYLLGLIVLEDPDIPARIDVAKSREHLEQAVSNCPAAVLARFHLALLSHASGQSDKALEILKQLEEILPGNFLWPFFLGRVYEKLGWNFEAETSYRKALSVLPNHLLTLRSLFSLAKKNHAHQKAIQLAQRLENLGSWDDLARFWIEHENLERAESILERSLKNLPARRSVRLALFDLFVVRGKTARAAKLLAETNKLFPEQPLVLQKQADFLDRISDHAGAQRIRAKLVALAPWNLRARQALGAAGDLTDLRLAGERKVDAKELIAEYLKAKPLATGHSVLVLDQMAVQTGNDGSSVERMHTIVHIRSPEGLEHWGEIDQIPPGAIIEEIRTIKPDGLTVNAEAIPGKDTISLRALQVGDFVELSYLSSSASSNLVLDTGGWVGRRWYFRAAKTPIYLSLFSVAVPQDSHLQIDSHGSPVKPVFNSENGFDIASWETRSAAQVMPEPNSPATDEYTPFVQVGFDVDWKDYRDVLQVELNEASLPNSDLKRFAKKIAKSKIPRENIRLIFHKVCSMFRQTGSGSDFSEPASHILARREGNRLVLLVALLRSIGVKSRVLLVRTNSDSQIEYKFPNMSTFRHGLVKVELRSDPNPIWLDPSSTFNPFDSLYPFVLGAQAIDINSKTGTAPFVRLPDQYGPVLTKTIQLDLSLAADGTLTGTGLERMPTAEAANYRELLTSMSAAQRRQAS